MGRKERMKELYAKVDAIKPFAEKDGEVWVSFEDAATLNSYNADEPNTGMQTRNADGTLASTGKTVHAVNPDYFFANRYKVKGKKLHVVSGHEPTGYRCIKEQSSGHVFVKTIPVYIIARDEEKNLVLEKVSTISDTEFISDFTNTLDHKSMAEILPLITENGSGMTADTMPI
jgi:hypothetical protein